MKTRHFWMIVGFTVLFWALCFAAIVLNPHNRGSFTPPPKGMHWSMCLEPDR